MTLCLVTRDGYPLIVPICDGELKASDWLLYLTLPSHWSISSIVVTRVTT